MITRSSIVFADLLRYLRQEAGFTQEELAERAGLSRRGISDIERGLNRRPRRDTITRLAAALALGDGERTVFERAARSQLVTRGPLLTFPESPESDHRPFGAMGQGVALRVVSGW